MAGIPVADAQPIVVMVITLIIGFRKYRNHHTPLIRTLYRDGTLFFVLLFRKGFPIIQQLGMNDAYFCSLLVFQSVVSLANIVNLAAGVVSKICVFRSRVSRGPELAKYHRRNTLTCLRRKYWSYNTHIKVTNCSR